MLTALSLFINYTHWCIPDAKVTGYVRGEGSPRTADGTSIYTSEPIAAASWNIPMGSLVDVEDIGTYRVADRGALGSYGWIDIAVWSYNEAYALTSNRMVCVRERPLFLPRTMLE